MEANNAAEEQPTVENQAPDQPKGPGKRLFTKETAAEYGRRGGLARKAPKGEEYLRAKAMEMTSELVAAASGKGRWSELPLDKQFAALLKVLEYGFGKPTTKKQQEEEQSGFSTGLPGV